VIELDERKVLKGLSRPRHLETASRTETFVTRMLTRDMIAVTGLHRIIGIV